MTSQQARQTLTLPCESTRVYTGVTANRHMRTQRTSMQSYATSCKPVVFPMHPFAGAIRAGGGVGVRPAAGFVQVGCMGAGAAWAA